ncbi:hypothetical protein ASG49_05375 [Marmoricola sp. Leaf446]|uniref:hypothetical protein n=1 Tax=Marmoricola sp. Leaf446 TaxID=1736379 RepID=UPI0006F7AA36|nr:hypothetical protein [Marmoricola sp. Leaf446]KQT94319.1 hypothetical protein ASG49_05375 [Marmoricola sp. Leaf446]
MGAEGGLLVLLFLVFLIGLSLWGVVDAALQPDRAYAEIGLRKGLVTGLMILTCAVGAAGYFAFVRPRLKRVQR